VSYRCERCGTLLPAIDAVCPRCDRELATPEPSPPAGTYRCPACDARFDRPTPTLRPRQAPWYRPQFPAIQCPHCATELRDRKRVHHSVRELALFWLALVAADFSPWRPYAQIAVAVVFFAVELRRWLRVRSASIPEAERFAIEDARK
jgi:uncharacterized paraquat-inducible protein A